MDACVVQIPAAPRTRDIGVIDAPVLICGGVCSNLEALTAFLEAARRAGIPAERIIHTGDAVAYGADPVRVTERLRQTAVHAIQGNVEESLARRRSECSCGFDRGSPCDTLSADWFGYADARIGSGLRAWMGGLPHQLVFTMAGRRVRVVHGGVTEINRFLYPSTPDRDFEAEFAAAAADVVIAGHGSIPFTQRFGSRVWHNSGALGLPANDGTPRVWYSRLEPEGDNIRFTHMPLAYERATARRKMLQASLPRGYADALSTCLWPSLDSLPPAEQAQTGRALRLAA
ncbi:MAG: metallophosphoesterase family protein [Methyloligellaceae bacterium]